MQYEVKTEPELESRAKALSEWFQSLSQTYSLLHSPAAVRFLCVPSEMLAASSRVETPRIARMVTQCPPSTIFASKLQGQLSATAKLSNGARINGFQKTAESASCFMGIPSVSGSPS
jgi:hypothetical protein